MDLRSLFTEYNAVPSLLAADFCRLGEQIDKLRGFGVKRLHADIMDGRFVPNLSFGFPVLESIKSYAPDMELCVHLMIEEPARYIRRFANAGAVRVIVHAENAGARELELIRSVGAEAGVSVRPGTPLESIRDILPLCGCLLVMTVEPGFGAQEYMPESDSRIAAAWRLINETNPGCKLAADGGINERTLPRARQSGADTFIMGSAVFNAL